MQKAMFFNYIFIFDEHKIHSFQNLLHNHKYIISQFGFKNIQGQIILHQRHPDPGV